MKIVSSKLLLKAGLLSFTSLLLASSAFSQGGGLGLAPGGDRYTWNCRASDQGSSGLFYFGLDVDRDAAEDKALTTCLRFLDSCRVDCEKLQY